MTRPGPMFWPAVVLLSLAAAGRFSVAGDSPRGGQARPPIESILPRHFGFGISCFGAAGDWPERMRRERGVAWDFYYMYLVPVGDVKARNEHLTGFLRRSERAGAIPIVSFYQLLDRGRKGVGHGSDLDSGAGQQLPHQGAQRLEDGVNLFPQP